MRHTFLPLALLLLGSAPLHAQQHNVDVLRYRFDVSVPERGKSVRIASTVQFTRGAGVETLRLDLLEPMKVTAATIGCGSAPASAPFTHDGRVVSVPIGAPSAAVMAPPDPVRPAGLDTLCVTVRYEGEPRDGLIISTDSAGRYRAFGDNWPDRGRHWLATVDHPSDKALVEFVVEAPAALRVIANGTQRAATDLPGRPARRRTTWATSLPIPTYLMVIAAAHLTEHDLGPTACGFGAVERCVPQRVYTAPEQARHMPGNFARADSIVSFFGRTIGPFPYEQLLHLQSSTRFGGMENAGAIFYADRLFRSPNGVGTSLIAHETAHQWFGDAVTEAEWGHLWLSEGFATYFAAVYTQHAEGDSAFRAEMRRTRDEILAAKVVAERPVIDSAQTVLLELLNTNSYQKGGWVLHMLRGQVGDSAFFRGVRDYYAGHVHRNAVTGHVQLAMERSSGQDLRWFFDQWLRRPGFAELRLTWKFDAARGFVIVTAEQGSRFAPYRISLPVELTLADGTVQVVRIDIPATGTSEVVVRERLNAAPAGVRFDPGADVLGRIVTP